MSDAQHPEHPHEHHHHHHGHHHPSPTMNLYLVIFAALSVFTIASFLINGAVRATPPMLTHTQGFALILGVAVVKATLVGIYFMHLKHDWGRLFFIIVPVMIMGTLLVVVLLPDIVLAWWTT